MLSPKDLLDLYNNGLPAALCDQDLIDQFLSEIPKPLFGDFSNDIKDSGKGKLCLPFKCVKKLDPKFGEDEMQETGDCVSHSTRNAVDMTRSFEILEKKENESFIIRSATEAIYGSRGHGGQGMQCSQAAKFVSKIGGILLRQKYGNVDLRKYNAANAHRWGRSGVPQTLINAGKQNQVQTVSLVKTVNETRDALANGYGISVCSNLGFSEKRDKNGISRRKGSWSHAMAWCAVDDTRTRDSEMLFLVQNSWGVWNSGPRVHDQPEGSFWIRESDAAYMLSQNGSWVFSNTNGFPPNKVLWTLGEVF